MLIGFFLS